MSLRKIIFSGLVVVASASVFAVTKAPEQSDLREAKRLRDDRRYLDAEAVYENWLKAHPEDGYAHCEYGYTLFLQASGEEREVDAAVLRLKARTNLLQARAEHYTEAVMDTLLLTIDEHGGVVTPAFSGDPEAQQLMQRGEQAFSRGKLDDALAAYQRAAEIDPHAYSAPLFVGDVYFNRGDYPTAIIWFEKAAAIDPDVETPHRYWADALMKLRQRDAAIEHYIDAVIANPHSKLCRQMMDRIIASSGPNHGPPPVPIPRTRVTMKDKKIVIGMDPKTSDAMVLAYCLARTQWIEKEREHYFSADSPVRHSLPEEMAGLRAFVAVVSEGGAKEPALAAKWNDAAAQLTKLDRDGFLEAYVLLDRSDDGIAKDYASYRLEHREVIRHYIHQVWFGQK